MLTNLQMYVLKDFIPARDYDLTRAELGETYLLPVGRMHYVPHYDVNVNLKPVLDVLRTKRSNWGVAYWFAASNGYLGGATPINCLSDISLVLLAAKDEIAGVTHG